LIDLCDRRLIDPGGIMERPDRGSPLPSDPPGREDIMSDGQAGRDDARSAGPEGGTIRPGGDDSPLPSDPVRREDVIREDVIRDDDIREDDIRDDDIREDVVSDAERPERRSRR
jgi:hypothetical protein